VASGKLLHGIVALHRIHKRVALSSHSHAIQIRLAIWAKIWLHEDVRRAFFAPLIYFKILILKRSPHCGSIGEIMLSNSISSTKDAGSGCFTFGMYGK